VKASVTSKLLSTQVTAVIAANRDLWQELKGDLHAGAVPWIYGSPLGAAFQYAARKRLATLDPELRRRLEQYAQEKLPPDAPDRSASALMVAQIMTRAARTVSRWGCFE
jgi:hypothetical protein